MAELVCNLCCVVLFNYVLIEYLRTFYRITFDFVLIAVSTLDRPREKLILATHITIMSLLTFNHKSHGTVESNIPIGFLLLTIS